jgi:hypothetical protein
MKSVNLISFLVSLARFSFVYRFCFFWFALFGFQENVGQSDGFNFKLKFFGFPLFETGGNESHSFS